VYHGPYEYGVPDAPRDFVAQTQRTEQAIAHHT
jgi:hypothetical protein